MSLYFSHTHLSLSHFLDSGFCLMVCNFKCCFLHTSGLQQNHLIKSCAPRSSGTMSEPGMTSEIQSHLLPPSLQSIYTGSCQCSCLWAPASGFCLSPSAWHTFLQVCPPASYTLTADLPYDVLRVAH